jgi:hypothetical protein
MEMRVQGWFAPMEEPAGGGETGALRQARENIVAGARETAAKAKAAATELAADARERVDKVATDRKDQAAQRMDGVGAALRESARKIEPQDPNIAWFAHRTADRLQGVADYVRSRDFGALRQDTEAFARRHPAAFFGGLFVTGLILGNVVKAGRVRMDESPDIKESEGVSPETGAETESAAMAADGAQPEEHS